jgi:hypothetical protein
LPKSRVALGGIRVRQMESCPAYFLLSFKMFLTTVVLYAAFVRGLRN